MKTLVTYNLTHNWLVFLKEPQYKSITHSSSKIKMTEYRRDTQGEIAKKEEIWIQKVDKSKCIQRLQSWMFKHDARSTIIAK